MTCMVSSRPKQGTELFDKIFRCSNHFKPQKSVPVFLAVNASLRWLNNVDKVAVELMLGGSLICFSFPYTTFILLTKVSYTKFKFKLFRKNGNYNCPSEEHFKNSKTSKGSYLDLELSTLLKIFEIYLVKQSPKIMISYPPHPSHHLCRYLCIFRHLLISFYPPPRTYNDGARIISIF